MQRSFGIRVLVTAEDSLLKEEEEELGCGAILFCEIKGSIKSQNCSLVKDKEKKVVNYN